MYLVTAVITTHKRPPEIVERAIKSVLSQSYGNIETIVVDDSPADFSLRNAVKSLAEGYGVKYIPHEKCQGACVARNTGLANATGEFIAYLDDDDEWKPEKIEKQLALFTSDKIAIVYCGSERKYTNTGKIVEQNIPFHSGMIYDELIMGNFVGSTSFPLMRTDVLRSIGGFDPLMQSAQDYDVWLRISKEYEVTYTKEPLVLYYIHEGEQISKSSTKKIAGLERIIEKNKEYIDTHKQAFWTRTMILTPEYARNRQLGKAFKVWFRAVIKCPWNIWGNLLFLYRIIKITLKAAN